MRKKFAQNYCSCHSNDRMKNISPKHHHRIELAQGLLIGTTNADPVAWDVLRGSWGTAVRTSATSSADALFVPTIHSNVIWRISVKQGTDAWYSTRG
jgi:hypothetical protein